MNFIIETNKEISFNKIYLNSEENSLKSHLIKQKFNEDEIKLTVDCIKLSFILKNVTFI